MSGAKSLFMHRSRPALAVPSRCVTHLPVFECVDVLAGCLFRRDCRSLLHQAVFKVARMWVRMELVIARSCGIPYVVDCFRNRDSS